MIRDIEARHLKSRYEKPRLKDVKRIAIDEIAVRKGHTYMTVVLDLDSGRVIFVGDGRGGDALTPFWKRLRRSGAKIEAVAADRVSRRTIISCSLRSIRLCYLRRPRVQRVGRHIARRGFASDRFHIVKLLNEKLNAMRRRMYREMTDAGDRASLKGIRWILLKRPKNLNPDRSEPERLARALKSNEDLAAAYYLKEELSEIWEQDDRDAAESLLTEWIEFAESLKIPKLHDFARTLRRHAIGILAYYDAEISTGPLEGVNNKIKTMKRKAYGFRDMEYFKLKILAIHRTRYELVG